MGRTNLNANFARSVSAFRKACDENSADFSRLAGISKTSYLQIERGEANPTLDTVQIVADHLGVDPLLLLGAPENYAALLMLRTLENVSDHTLETMRRSALSVVDAIDYMMEFKLSQARDSQEPAKR